MRSRLVYVGIGLVAITFVAIFLVVSKSTYATGFPLDDAWIHQTFARNLAERGEWAFNPGQPAAGSTSPFWTVLLSIGFWLKIPTFTWTISLGVLILALTGSRTYIWFKTRKTISWSIALSILVIGEWHLVWAAASGMETLLQAFLCLVVLLELLDPKPRWILVGVLTGLSLWTRPDGLTLLGPILVAFVVYWKTSDTRREISRFILPFLLLLVGYLWFNYSISGSVWPNTLFAKQMEYQEPGNLVLRYFRLWQAPLAGIGMVVLPGFLYGIYHSIKKKDYLRIAIILWILGFVGLYALRLPVLYQHGRYVMPILAIYLVFSLDSLGKVDFSIFPKPIQFVITRTYTASVILVALIFLWLGASAYAMDVAIIQTEMVEPAKWIAQNTPSGSLIAAHDIGALGYFGNREILDLAGLIDPVVIPIIRNQEKLSDYIQARHANYLMIFPDWYQPPLPIQTLEVYRSLGKFAIQSGGGNMAIYLIE